MTPDQHRQYARSQMALAADMERRPNHMRQSLLV
jgi:hypothetical protein